MSPASPLRRWLSQLQIKLDPSSWRPLYQSPIRLLLLLSAAIFFGETCVMLLLSFFQPLPVGGEALLDSAMLLIVISPTFYFLLFRPFMFHLQHQKRCQEEVSGLSRRLMALTEEERKKVAMDLHDHFGQVVTGLHFGLESLHSALVEKKAPEHSHTAELISRVQNLAEDFRRYATGLRPALIDDLGLVPTLEWHIGELSKQHPELRFSFRHFGIKQQPTAAAAETLFRICQESLNNVLKHAQAREVEIVLVYCHPSLILTVRDDGVGFSRNLPTGHGGIGLWSMGERAALVGGTVQIDSRPGAGTQVRTELPMEVTTDE
ncbi:MAG: sensor histidine kinase [Desulfuromonadales bacterium]|nr:sensor histidine kinase [Desulfuromonadales bacterium]